MNEEIKGCIHDNPVLMRREAWRNGRLACSIAFSIFYLSDEHYPPGRFIPWYMPTDPFEPGRVIGDPEAMQPERKGAK